MTIGTETGSRCESKRKRRRAEAESEWRRERRRKREAVRAGPSFQLDYLLAYPYPTLPYGEYSRYMFFFLKKKKLSEMTLDY